MLTSVMPIVWPTVAAGLASGSRVADCPAADSAARRMAVPIATFFMPAILEPAWPPFLYRSCNFEARVGAGIVRPLHFQLERAPLFRSRLPTTVSVRAEGTTRLVAQSPSVKRFFLILLAAISVPFAAHAAPEEWERHAKNVEIIRDDWGIAHVY